MTRAQAKNYVLPAAMIGGAVFYPWMDELTFLSPYFIFAMLFVTYCRLELRKLRLTRFHWALLACQLLLAAAVYFALSWWNQPLASGIMLCVLIPTACAAPVITSMLGGSLENVVSYSLLSNVMLAIVGPIVLALVGTHADMTFFRSAGIICSKVFPLILGPMALALILGKISPKAHYYIANHQSLSFYLWAVSLFVVVGCCVSFAIKHYEADNVVMMVLLAVGALAVCGAQFILGKKIGERYGDRISGGQSLGQKNTVLAVWLALAYLEPLTSIAPAAYIAWQNLINAWQLMHHRENQQAAQMSYIPEKQ